MLHPIASHITIWYNDDVRRCRMATKQLGRPKSIRGQKVHTAFKIWEDDKQRLIRMAEKHGMTVSNYVMRAVLDKVAKDEAM